MQAPKALIVGLKGTALSEAERQLFIRHRPAGFILFRRNCDDPAQLAGLVSELHRAVPHWHPLIFVDQEGGRVARLRPPRWCEVPPLKAIGDLATIDLEAGLEAASVHAGLIANDLRDAGIDVVCAPVLDVATERMTDAIGDRAFARNPLLVARLGQATIDAFERGNVLPVIKHLPGHGRAVVDSHAKLPRVTASLGELEASDFIPFIACRNVPFAITAHIVYEAIDPDYPASQSRLVIEDVIRGAIGFEGIILSDDISMQALSGSLVERARGVLDAGCDLAVHCTGRIEEAEALLQAVPDVDEKVCAGLLEAARQPRRLDLAARPRAEDLERFLKRLT